MNDTLKHWMDKSSELNERVAASAVNAFDWLFRKESLVKSGQTPHTVIHAGDPMSVRHYDLDDAEIPLSDDTVMPVRRRKHAIPLVLVPHLGMIRTGLLFGLMNAAVAVWALLLFRHELRHFAAHAAACAATLAVLAGGWAAAGTLTTLTEDRFYNDRIVFTASSPYQRIVVTHSPGEGRAGHRLFLNGNLQFAERDEYRYHEALVHPVMAAFAAAGAAPRKVAVLGGGDGMAVREILRYPGVQSVTLVELDPAMTTLFTQNEIGRAHV